MQAEKSALCKCGPSQQEDDSAGVKQCREQLRWEGLSPKQGMHNAAQAGLSCDESEVAMQLPSSSILNEAP